jgi:hypothetical protein
MITQIDSEGDSHTMAYKDIRSFSGTGIICCPAHPSPISSIGSPEWMTSWEISPKDCYDAYHYLVYLFTYAPRRGGI